MRDPRPLAPADVAHVLEHALPVWPLLDGARLFLTGGTGFFGRWLVEILLRAADEGHLRLEIVLLTRDPARFAAAAPHLAGDPRVRLHAGDVRTFAPPEGAFSHIVHAAAEADMRAAERDTTLTRSTIVDGTARTLDLAERCGARRVLFTSSGAVYGRQLPAVSHIGEDDAVTDDPAGSYAMAKRVAEGECVERARTGLAVTIARPFAFVGPHLPLDEGFAIGNFIRDALAGGPVRVHGDGTAIRSYLHSADLTVWLLMVLVHGRPGRSYNVGSEEAVTIAEAARRVARAAGTDVHIAARSQPGAAADRYVPSTARARDELGLRARIGLDEAISRTLRWYGRDL